jgi:hypothetical protein
MWNTKHLKLIIVTPVFILLCHHLAFFLHEYAHAFVAWMLGYKISPFDINYGGFSPSNILLLSNVDQDVDNSAIYSLGHPGHVALIASAGLIMNGILFVLSLFSLKHKNIKDRPYTFYFLFLFNLMNLGNLYCYIPIRTFANTGDIFDIRDSLDLSPWWIYVIFTYLVAFLIWHFFTRTLIAGYINLKITTIALSSSFMIMCVFILFGYFGLAGFLNQDEISHFLSATSFVSIPGIILALWPTRNWVLQQLHIYEMLRA